MDVPVPFQLPAAVAVVEPEQALADLVAAIELVATGAARRVVVAGLPGLDAAAPEALAVAQAAHVRFALARDARTGPPRAIVGPREP